MTTLTRLLPEASGSWDLGDDDLPAVLAGLYAPQVGGHGVRINMISSLNGSAVGEDGTSETLSNRVDRAILKAIRAMSDVVLVGARTVRREGYLAPPDSTSAVVTLSGDLTGHRLHSAARPPLILRPDSVAERVADQLEGIPHRTATLDSPALDAAEVLRAIRESGGGSIVCEGGPTLAAAFLDAGLVDELCLTTAPKLRSPGVPLLARLHDTLETELAQLLADSTGMLYARWRVVAA